MGVTFAQQQFADVVWIQRQHPTQDSLSSKAASESIPPRRCGAGKLSPIELKAEILRQIDARENEIIKKICGGMQLTGSQKKPIVALHRGGVTGTSADELQQRLGYSVRATTNTANTVISQLRKIFGREFIKNEGGRYKLSS